MGELNKKVAVITGVISDIGEAIVTEYSLAGAKVAFCGTNELLGQGILQTIKKSGGAAMFANVDVADKEAIRHFFADVSIKFGNADILITLPVIRQNKAFKELTVDDWNDEMEKNGLGSLYGMWEVIPAMKKKKCGSIIAVTSLYGTEPDVKVAFDAFFMAGMHNFVKCMNMEYSPYGVRVNALEIGLIEETDSHLSKESVFQVMGDDSLRRAGKPSEVAKTALWLGSENASYVSGAIIRVNGGVVSRGMETLTWKRAESEAPRDFEK